MESENTRIDYWDNIKGFLIFLVVLGHFLYDRSGNYYLDTIGKAIFVFHMPLFIFISGFFSKSKKSRSEERLLELMTLYVVGNIFFMAYDYFIKNKSIDLIAPYYSYWYILALIVWRLTIEQLNKVKGILPISIINAIFVGFFSNINNTFALCRIICFFPFFVAGYNFNNERIQKIIKNKDWKKYLIGLIIVVYALLMIVCFVEYASYDILKMFPYTNGIQLLYRVEAFALALLIGTGIIFLGVDKKIPFITKWGRNSLYIYFYHRVFVLLLGQLFKNYNYYLFIGISIALSILICLVLGSDFISQISKKMFRVTDVDIRKKALACTIVLVVVNYPLLEVARAKYSESKFPSNNTKNDLYLVLSSDEKEKFDNSFRILFTGDLILLQEQVRRGYDKNSNQYDFSNIFEYTNDYIQNADLSIGVFEGPMAGEEVGYSNSDFDDGKKLYLNFPDEYGKAVKNAGFDLVTLSNNHILDKGEIGAKRTIDKLDNIGLAHVGAYKNEEEKNKSFIIEKNGLKIGVLAYTYGCNYFSEEELINQNITSILVSKESAYFEKVKKNIEEDFRRIKEESPDLIVVLPHMGTQFSTEVDSFQETWNEIFIENGADIILGDHAHSVQPIQFMDKNGKDAIIVNCPGNFVNSYREYNGDATAIVEIYIDKNTKKINGSSIIPMWVQAEGEENYRAIPVYKIQKDKTIKSQLSTDDMERVREVYSFISEVMIGERLNVNSVEEKNFYTKEGYKRQNVQPIEIKNNNELSSSIEFSKSICFIGDSITEGTKNGGYGWFEPLINGYQNKVIYKVAKGGATSKTITEEYKENRKIADLYIVAIGTNDIRYRDKSICSMTADDYVKQLDYFVSTVPNKEEAKFAFVTPWLSMENDTNSKLEHNQKNEMIEEYGTKLKEFCEERDFIFIDANKYLRNCFEKENYTYYLNDFIHPNGGKGIELYSEAVLESCNSQ